MKREATRNNMAQVYNTIQVDAPRIQIYPFGMIFVVAIMFLRSSSFVDSFHAQRSNLVFSSSQRIRHSEIVPIGRCGIVQESSIRQWRSGFPPQGLAAKNKWGKNLDEFCAEQESRAIAASESWIVEATDFLDPEESSALMDKLAGRADVACLSIGSYSQRGRRVRCIYSNPDLGYDAVTAESDYISYLKIDNVALSECDPWPNILVKIGISLKDVGDIFLVSNQSTAYLAVVPESEKTCMRLLPKELPGTGVTVTKLTKEDMEDSIAGIGDSEGDMLQNMEVQRIDKRK